MRIIDTSFDIIKNIAQRKREQVASAQPGQQHLLQPAKIQTNLQGDMAEGETPGNEVSQFIQRIDAKQKERIKEEKAQAKHRASMIEAAAQPGQQTIPQPDQDIQEVVQENDDTTNLNMGFRRGFVEEMEMLGMIQKDERKKKMGDSYADAQMNPDHPAKRAPTSYDMHGKPIQGDREIEDLGAGCDHCGEGHTIYTDDGARGCSTEDCIANTPEMLQQGDGYPQYKRQELTEQKVGEVTPTRTYQENKDKPPGGLAGLFPMEPDPNFEPHVRINAMRPQQVSQLVDAQGNPSTTMQQMRHEDIRAGEPMDIAMRLLKHAESPAAKKHKHDYDTKYESSPERRKYRTELTQERRKRHVDGKGGKDMSHTAQGTIVPEDMHANRARHFKERGTLKKTVAVVSYSEPIGKRV